MLYTQFPPQAHGIRHFCGRTTGQRGLEREKRGTGSNWECEWGCCLAARLHRTQIPIRLGSFSSEMWLVLRWRTACVLHSPHIYYQTEEFKYSFTSLCPILTCYNSFKSSTHCFTHLPGDHQHLPWCKTPTETVVSSICFPDKDKSTLSTVIVFPLSIRCRNTNLLVQGRKLFPPQ